MCLYGIVRDLLLLFLLCLCLLVFLPLQATEGAYGRWLSADVVCHELAHQWFGDYVTCTDFDNIVGELIKPPSCYASLMNMEFDHNPFIRL